MQAILEAVLLKGVANIALNYLSAEEQHVLNAFFGTRPIVGVKPFLVNSARVGWLEAIQWAIEMHTHNFLELIPYFTYEIVCLEAAHSGHGEVVIELYKKCDPYVHESVVVEVFNCVNIEEFDRGFGFFPRDNLTLGDKFRHIEGTAISDRVCFANILLLAAANHGSLTDFLIIYEKVKHAVNERDPVELIIARLLIQLQDVTEDALITIYEQVFPDHDLDLTPLCICISYTRLAIKLIARWEAEGRSRKAYAVIPAATAA